MRSLALVAGAAGALLAARYGALCWRVIHGSGDGALLFLGAALLSCIPASGLLVGALPGPHGPLAKLWLAVSALVLALITPFALM